MNQYTYEVRPCIELEDGVSECAESEADYFGVYEREVIDGVAGLGDWVADFAHKNDAEMFAMMKGTV